MNVRKLLEELGFNGNQGEIDDSIQWALVELFLLRKENKNNCTLPKLSAPSKFDAIT